MTNSEQGKYQDGIQTSFFHIRPVPKLRETPGILFNAIPVLDNLQGIDYVWHEKNGISPSIKDKKDQEFWYMHTCQEDNLVVIEGNRFVHLYDNENKKREIFEVSDAGVILNGELLYKGMCIFGWPSYVYHRVTSGANGSKSINFAVRDKEFDIKTNFNIYSLNTDTGESTVERYGHQDQPNNK